MGDRCILFALLPVLAIAAARSGSVSTVYGDSFASSLRASGAIWDSDAFVIDDHPDHVDTRGMFATRDLLPGDPVAVVPLGAAMTLPSAIASSLDGFALTQAHADARALLAAAVGAVDDPVAAATAVQHFGIAAQLVLEHAKGARSAWAPYIASLPCARFLGAKRLGDACAVAPLMWGAAARELAALVLGSDRLSGEPSVAETLDAAEYAARGAFDRLTRTLEAVSGGGGAPRPTFAQYKWGLAIAASRAVDIPAADAGGVLSVLAPLVDMVNAPSPGRRANARVAGVYTGNTLAASFVGPRGIAVQQGDDDGAPFEPPANAVSVVATRAIAAGDEIVVDYAAVSSSAYDCFLRYGFASFGDAFSVQLPVHDVLLEVDEADDGAEDADDDDIDEDDVDDADDADDDDDGADLVLMRKKTALLDRPGRARMVAITVRGIVDVASLLILRVAVATPRELKKHGENIADAFRALEREEDAAKTADSGSGLPLLEADYVISHENEQRSIRFLRTLLQRKIKLGKRNLKIANESNDDDSDEGARPPKTVSVLAMSPEATIAAFVGHELHVLEVYEKELEAVAKRWADGNFRVMPGEVRPGDVEIRELETKD